jgi:hypothetical protein
MERAHLTASRGGAEFDLDYAAGWSRQPGVQMMGRASPNAKNYGDSALRCPSKLRLVRDVTTARPGTSRLSVNRIKCTVTVIPRLDTKLPLVG